MTEGSSDVEASRDISDKQFTCVLSGLEIDALLSAVGFATGAMVKSRNAPDNIDLVVLGRACDKLTVPVEEDYKVRSSERQPCKYVAGSFCGNCIDTTCRFHTVNEMIQAEKDNQSHAIITDEEAYRIAYSRWRGSYNKHIFEPSDSLRKGDAE